MSRFTKLIDFKKPKFLDSLIKPNDLIDDNPFENLEELDLVTDLKEKRVFFAQLLQRGLVNVMSTLDVNSAGDLTQADTIVVTFTEVLFRIFLFGFKGDNYWSINGMIVEASDKIPKLKRLIKTITKLRPNQSQAAGRFFGFVILLLNENLILEFISLFHIVSFATAWYEKWSFLGQEKYVSMIETIGDGLNELKFNLSSHEGRGSMFDQVRLRRDEYGIIRKCLPTYNMWLDGKARSAEENRRIFVTSPLPSDSYTARSPNFFPEAKKEEKSPSFPESSALLCLEDSAPGIGFQSTDDYKRPSQVQEPVIKDKKEEEATNLQKTNLNILRKARGFVENTIQVSNSDEDRNTSKFNVVPEKRKLRYEEERKEKVSVVPELSLDDPGWPDSNGQKKNCRSSEQKCFDLEKEQRNGPINTDEVEKQNCDTGTNDSICEMKETAKVLDVSNGTSMPLNSDAKIVPTHNFPLPIIDSQQTRSSSLPTIVEAFGKRPNKNHRAKKLASFGDSQSSGHSLHLTSVLEGTNKFELSLSCAEQNSSVLANSSTAEDALTRPVLPSLPNKDLENPVPDRDRKVSDTLMSRTMTIQSPSFVDEHDFETFMPIIEADSFFDGRVAGIDSEGQAGLNISESEDDLVTTVVHATKAEKWVDAKRQVSPSYEFADPHLSILSNKYYAEVSINPTPPASIQQTLPSKMRMTNQSLQKNGSPFMRSAKPTINVKYQNLDSDIKEIYGSSSSSAFNELNEEKEQVLSGTSSVYTPETTRTISRRWVSQEEENKLLCWKAPVLDDKLLPNAVRNLQNEFCPKLLNRSRYVNFRTETRKFSGWLLKMGLITKTYKRRYFMCNLDKDFMLRYWKKQEPLKNPEGMIDLSNIVDVCCYPGPRMERRSSRVAEVRERVGSEQEVQINLHTESKILVLQTDEFVAEWLSLFNMALRQNEARCALTNEFEEKCSESKKSMSGYLSKRGVRNKGWKRRYCILVESTSSPPYLKYYKDRDAKWEQGMIKLENAVYVGPCLDSDVIIYNPYAFEIFEHKRVWTLACNNPEQFKAWVESLSTAIQRYKLDKADLSSTFPQAEIVKAGYMCRRTSSTKLTSKKIGKYSWKRQYVVLSESELWFCNTMTQYHNLHRFVLLKLDGGKPNFSAGEGLLRIRGMDIRRLVGNFFGKEGVVGIKSPERTVFLHAADEFTLNEWITAICDIAGCKEAAVPASTRIFI